MSLQFSRQVLTRAMNLGANGVWLTFKATRLEKITVSVRAPAANEWHRINKETIYKGMDNMSGKLQGKTECDILFTHLGLKGPGEEVVGYQTQGSP